MYSPFYGFFFSMVVEDGFLKTFFEKTKTMSPHEIASYLEEDDVSVGSDIILFVPSALVMGLMFALRSL